MNVTCGATTPCPVILNSTCVFYEGANLIYTGINTNDNLQTALEKIDANFADIIIGGPYLPLSGGTLTGGLIFLRANNTGDGAGQIYLNGANGNRIDWSIAGVNPPTLTTRSVGTKLVLYPSVSASLVDHAIGIENGTTWFSVPSTSSAFKFYGGITVGATLTGAGALTLSSTATATSFIPTDSTIPINGMYLPAANTLGFSTNGTLDVSINPKGDVGVGVSPSIWGEGKALEIGFPGNSVYSLQEGDVIITQGVNYAIKTTIPRTRTPTFLLKNSNYPASIYRQFRGEHIWYYAPQGITGDVANMGAVMRIYTSGNLRIDNTVSADSGERLQVDGTAMITGATSIGGTLTANSFIPTSSTVPTNGMYLPSANTLGFATNSTLDMVLDANGNLGIGVTPSAWSGPKVLQLGPTASLSGSYGNTYLSNNSFYDGTNFRYEESSIYATQYIQQSGGHYWTFATNGIGGNIITFTDVMALHRTGNLTLGGPGPFLTDSGERLQVTGDTLMKGSGTTSASIALTVNNSSGTNMLRVFNNGDTRIGTTNSYINIDGASATKTIRIFNVGIFENIISVNAGGYHFGANGGPINSSGGSVYAKFIYTDNIISGNNGTLYNPLYLQGGSYNNHTTASIGFASWDGGINNIERLIIYSRTVAGVGGDIVANPNNGNFIIGTTVSNRIESAQLQIESTTKGFLPPRMTTTQKNAITTPAAGLQVYDSTLNQMSYYNGTTWINF